VARPKLLLRQVSWHGSIVCISMRNIIQDQVSHRFIEGPGLTIDTTNPQVTSDEKAARRADPSQASGGQEDYNASIYDNDRPYYDPNERYD